MKILKTKNILFSLLAMMAVAVFMTSCEQGSMMIEEISETEILEKQSIVFIYGNKTYKVSTREDGSLNQSEVSEELQQLMDDKHIVKLDGSNTLHLFDSEDATKDFIMDATRSTQVVEMESVKNDSPTHIRYYKDTNLQGMSESQIWNPFYANVLRFSTLNNSISSCMLYNPAIYTAVAVFYDYKNYRGATFTIVASPYSQTSYLDFQDFGFDNRASSMRGYYYTLE